MKELIKVMATITFVVSCSGNKTEPKSTKSALKSTNASESNANSEKSNQPVVAVEPKKEDAAPEVIAADQQMVPDPTKADPLAAMAADLAKACKGAGVKTDRTSIFIPSNSGARCPYGMGDNLSKAAAKIRARIEASYPTNIPKTRKLCSMAMDAGILKMDYNDQLILSLNKSVILSSSNEVEKLTADSTGFKKYSWDLIKDSLSDGNSKYCGPKVDCQLPANNATGKLSFTITNEAGNGLFTSVLGSDISLGLVLTGDNDDTDCNLGQNLQLNVEYTYVD